MNTPDSDKGTVRTGAPRKASDKSARTRAREFALQSIVERLST